MLATKMEKIEATFMRITLLIWETYNHRLIKTVFQRNQTKEVTFVSFAASLILLKSLTIQIKVIWLDK